LAIADLQYIGFRGYRTLYQLHDEREIVQMYGTVLTYSRYNSLRICDALCGTCITRP